ncbi:MULTISPECIES: ABC-2 family transporter protein [Petrotoga]|uniref:ABC-2 type transport system permease protein n=2 Tax=Petrotoga sibirica TaxID=156202 RepID=A0A4R8EDZ6_9BACT|nr:MULTISPECIES: ABC-2 family transporter protein [Petrotoga]POZ89281.1 ABC transporter permease [Petrotoga sibirica DSM 13575]POZ91053.1 ABC transporter permease [Petrotoga sp. SL27]TDX09972.1 ABC-2 type transport system permease protein [Petrotoga sibirica]
MFRNFKIRKRLIKIGFVVNQIYSEAVIVKIISNFLFIIMQYYIWKSIYETNNLVIFSFKEMFAYVVIAQIMSNVYPMQVSGRIGSMVKSGDIALTLLYPYSFTEQLLFENVGASIFKLLVLNIPLYVLYVLFIGNNLTAINIVKFIIMFLFSYLFYFVFELIFGILSFYTTSQWGLQNLKYAIIILLSGRVIPLEFYPTILSKILEKLPFQYMYNIPILTILDKNFEFQRTILMQCINLIIIFLIYRVCFDRVIKRLTIQGG